MGEHQPTSQYWGVHTAPKRLLSLRNWLVVSTPLKKLSQLGRIISISQYMMENNPFMFETTNQVINST